MAAKRKKRRKVSEALPKRRKRAPAKSDHTRRVTPKRREKTRSVSSHRVTKKPSKVKQKAPKTVRKAPAKKPAPKVKTRPKASPKPVQKPRRASAKKPAPKSKRRSQAAKQGWIVRNAKSILDTAEVLPSLFKKAKSPKPLGPRAALRRASFATYRMRNELLKDPTLENLKIIAADEDNIIEVEDDVYFNPFWYH